MKRIVRNRRLTSEENAKYRAIRKQVAEELPELVSRHHARMGLRLTSCKNCSAN